MLISATVSSGISKKLVKIIGNKVRPVLRINVFTAKKIEINRGSDMYVKWEGVQGEETRGGGGGDGRGAGLRRALFLEPE